VSEQSAINVENDRLFDEHITGIAFRYLLKGTINKAPFFKATPRYVGKSKKYWP
jgi:hypothetical protein